MRGLWQREKRARVVLGAGLPLLLLLLLPMFLVDAAKGISDIQAVPPASTRNKNTVHQHARSTASAGGEYDPLRALSANPLDQTTRGDVPFETRFVFEDYNWLDERSSPRASLPAEAAAAAASVGGSYPPRQAQLQVQRGMQTACSPGDDFSLISTVHAGAGGCYFEGVNDTNAYFTADQGRIVFPASISASSSTTKTFAWVAGRVLGFRDVSLDVDPECVSDEPWTVNSHPTDAGSWSCLVGGTLVPFSQESFAMECGCSGDSSGTADVGSTPAPASGGNAPAPVPNPSPAGVGCDADSISITSPQLDAFEGCYTDTGGVNSTINSHYGQTSSELGGGTNAVFAAPIDERGHDVRWVAGTYENMSTDSGIVPTCISDDDATSVHPADSTWLCDLTGAGTFMPVNETQFLVDCGCNSTSSSNINPEEPTPSPGANSRNINPSTPTEGSAGSEASSAASTPTPSPNTQSAAALESGANGGSSTYASGAFSAFRLAALAAVVGLARLFVRE